MTTTARDALAAFWRLNPDPLKTAAQRRDLEAAAAAEELAQGVAQTGYRIEFPDFDPADMPTLPEGWVDESWHNDSCPSFRSPTGFRIFIDYANAMQREFPETPRFSATRIDCEGAPLDDHADLMTDDWDALLALVHPDTGALLVRQARALKMAALMLALAEAGQAIVEAYDDPAVNEEQPTTWTHAVFPCSIDEWVGNIGLLGHAWRQRAERV